MKRYLSLVILAMVLILLFKCELFASEAIGKIILVKGECSVERPGKALEAVKVDMEVFQKDKFFTKADSNLRISLNDGSVLSLGPNAELSMESFEFNPQEKKRKATLGVTIGKLRTVVNELHDFKEKDFNVKTPTAIVGVRGTVFIVWVQSPVLTQVFCIDKSVFVANVMDPTKAVILDRMQSTDVKEKAPPAPPKPVTFEELQQVGKEVDIPAPTEKTKDEKAPEKGPSTEEPTKPGPPPSEESLPKAPGATTIPAKAPTTIPQQKGITTLMTTTLPTTTTTTSTTTSTTTTTTTTTTSTTSTTTSSTTMRTPLPYPPNRP